MIWSAKLALPKLWSKLLNNIDWVVAHAPVPYQDAVNFMEARAQAIFEGHANEMVWLLEHPPIFTIGTSGTAADIIDAGGIEIAQTGRGGQVTYHGPGQRVIYLMLDLRKRGRDVRKFVCSVEKWVIAVLAQIGITGSIRDGRIGVWVDVAQIDDTIREEKIAAIGLRIRHWVSFHGVSINIAPNLEHFGRINPCGMAIGEFGVTSVKALGFNKNIAQIDAVLHDTFNQYLINASQI